VTKTSPIHLDELASCICDNRSVIYQRLPRLFDALALAFV